MRLIGTRIAIFLLIFIFLFLLTVSLYKIISYINEGRSNEGNIYVETHTDNDIESKDKIPIAFEEYENCEVEGYIIIENLDINYPVMQSKSGNTFYLSHDYQKKYSNHGSIFFDYEADLESMDKLQNIFIYGHSMLDRTMFGKLADYTDKKTFAENRTIYLYLKKLNAKLTLEVFSAYIDDSNTMYEKNFADYKGRTNYIEKALLKGNAKQRTESKINTTITLYTCSYNNSRCYVHTIIKEIKYYER